MTNAEIIEAQRAAREHRESLPAALVAAEAALTDFNGALLSGSEAPREHVLSAGQLRTLLNEIARLQQTVKSHAEDLRDADRAARDAYSEGRWDEREEAHGDNYY